MNESSTYLISILDRYAPRDLSNHTQSITALKNNLKNWAHTCFIEIVESGSRAKGTAIKLASDLDLMVSLTSNCNENNGGLKGIYESLYTELNNLYGKSNNQSTTVVISLLSNSYTTEGLVKKQNVSIRINLDGFEVDVTPARKHSGNTNDHSLYVSKFDTWKKTNIQQHIRDVLFSERLSEIKLVKIWRELNKIDFTSIYLEYLLIDHILYNKSKSKDSLADNFLHILKELAKSNDNPLFKTVIDPANSTNRLSDLLTYSEKNTIIQKAKDSLSKRTWSEIIW